jgi:anhydro-N-acetylmuramic acid kinase
MIRLRSVRTRHEPEVLGHVHRPFPAAISNELLRPHQLRPDRLAELHFLLPEMYAEAVRALPHWKTAAVCGMHGQTVWHAPSRKRGHVPCTYQIGSSAVLAKRLGLPVVGDFRGADVALGGQGAPIVPFAHWFFTPPSRAPRLVVNFGGICNVTAVTKSADDVVACDVGPGMMLSDAFARRATGGGMSFDRDGRLSRRGRVVTGLVDRIVGHPFIRRRAPKSTGREDFGRSFFLPLVRRFSDQKDADVAFSLLVATAESLRIGVSLLSGAPTAWREVVLSGGGARNPVLVREVCERLAPAPVVVARRGVFAPEHHEAASMALIAARTLHGLPSSLARVTGASRPSVLGHVHAP